MLSNNPHEDPGQTSLSGATTRSTFLRKLAANLFSLLLLCAGVGGLAYMGLHSNPQGSVAARDPQTGAGTILRFEVRGVWFPEGWATLADRLHRGDEERTERGLRRMLEEEGSHSYWYAITLRAFLCDGHSVDQTFIRRPLDEPAHLGEFLMILDALAGRSVVAPFDGLSTAECHVLPKESTGREPREVMTELLSHPEISALRSQSEEIEKESHSQRGQAGGFARTGLHKKRMSGAVVLRLGTRAGSL